MVQKTTKPKRKHAFAICDRSGFKYPYNQMVHEPGTGLFVHWTESDGKWNLVDNPRNKIGVEQRSHEEIALRWASPDRKEPWSLAVFWVPSAQDIADGISDNFTNYLTDGVGNFLEWTGTEKYWRT